MREFLRHNSLSIVFLALFVLAIVGQAIAGHADFNEDQLRHGDAEVSLGRYILSSEFGTAVLENWQSEYLQSPRRPAASPTKSSASAATRTSPPRGGRGRAGSS